MIKILIEHKDHNDSSMFCFLTSLFKCSLEHDITNARYPKKHESSNKC